MNNPFDFRFPCNVTRRQLLAQAGNGFFGTAIAYLLAKDGVLGASTAAPSHFAPRAKSCIFLFMVGGPSHLDTFDPKPDLARLHATSHSFKATGAQTQKASGKLKGSPFAFAKHGRSGIEISELFPHLATCADDLAVVRSACCDSAAHGAASLQMNTGSLRTGFPSVGSWATYGLGSPNQNMPAFVCLVNGAPYSGAQNWGSGFMPAAYQGTVLSASEEPILNLAPAPGVTHDDQRRQLDLLDALNRQHLACEQGNTELAARIGNYELAFRMQLNAPDIVNLKDEPPATHALYGIGESVTDKFGRSCLMARRLVERGVRFVELFHSNWDTHGNNDGRHQALCAQTDKPIAGLLHDLKRRGLLDETLVVWAGEFGRTPLGGTDKAGGRDHHASAFSVWLAGGGIRGGTVHGRTDDLGFAVVENRVHVHDLHATILHLMGLDHERLTYRHAGRDYRLTDVHGHVVKEIIA